MKLCLANKWGVVHILAKKEVKCFYEKPGGGKASFGLGVGDGVEWNEGNGARKKPLAWIV